MSIYSIKDKNARTVIAFPSYKEDAMNKAIELSLRMRGTFYLCKGCEFIGVIK